MDDEVDVDGDDAVVYGDAQFTEGDILPLPDHNTQPRDEPEGGNDAVTEDLQPDTTLRDLVAEGKILKKVPEVEDAHLKDRMDEVMGVGEADKMDLAILAARRKGNSSALIAALENKIKQLVCFPYSALLNSQPSRTGVHPRGIIDLLALSNMYRSLQRAYCLYWLLAHVLSRLLAPMPWIDQVMSHL